MACVFYAGMVFIFGSSDFRVWNIAAKSFVFMLWLLISAAITFSIKFNSHE